MKYIEKVIQLEKNKILYTVKRFNSLKLLPLVDELAVLLVLAVCD